MMVRKRIGVSAANATETGRLRRSTGARASCPARLTPDGSSAGLEARAPGEEQPPTNSANPLAMCAP